MTRSTGVRRPRATAIALFCFCFLPVFAPSQAEAQERIGGHAGGGIGGAYINGNATRDTLDLAFDYLHAIGPCTETSAPLSTCYGIMASASLVTGFGQGPTFVTLDGGYGINGMIGGHLLAGPALRLGPQPGVGVDFQAIAYFFVLEVGPRFIFIPTGSNEAEITLVVGLGFN